MSNQQNMHGVEVKCKKNNVFSGLYFSVKVLTVNDTVWLQVSNLFYTGVVQKQTRKSHAENSKLKRN